MMQGSQRTRTHATGRALLAGALLCLLAGTSLPRTSEAAPSGQFTMSPSNVYLAVGDAVAITFIINTGTDIHEVYFQLSYDPAVVQLVDAQAGQPGVQVLQGPFPSSGSAGTMLQNSVAGGMITYQYALPGTDVDAGTGTVATAQFVALANGSANFQWQTLQLVDGNGVPTSAPGTVGTLLVGADTPTPGPTDTPTITPTFTDTPAAIVTETPTATASSTPAATETAAATSTAAASATPSPATTSTVAATSTPKITVVQDSNQGKPPQSQLGVDPSQAERADGLPSAGSAGRGVAWWRWIFFLAALMFGVAGWFFTLAVYNGNKEVVLIDRFDKRRRRK